MQTGNINIVFEYTNTIDDREIEYIAYFFKHVAYFQHSTF